MAETSQLDLAEMKSKTVPELQELAEDFNVHMTSTLRKQELIFKILEAQTIEHNLRYGVEYVDEEVTPEFKYSTEGSFKESVHMCTGVGECRNMLGGTMCPSFKATREEEHSTRGRAYKGIAGM